MSSSSSPGEAIAPPALPSNSTIIDDGISIASSATTPVATSVTEILDAILSSTSMGVIVSSTSAGTSPVETSLLERPVPGTPREGPPIVAAPVETQVPPPDDDIAFTSLSLSSTTVQAQVPPTTTVSSSVSTPSAVPTTPSVSTTSSTTDGAPTSSTEVVPSRDDDVDEQNNDEIETVERPAPVTSSSIETLPTAEASQTEEQREEPTLANEPSSAIEPTPTDEPVQTTAQMVDNETPEATSPAETSAVPIGGVVPNPEDNPSADVAEGGEERDEDRVDNVVIAEPEPIVTGPDRQFEDDSGSEEDDEDSGFPGGLPAPATTGIPEDGPTTTTLPNGDVSTIRPGGSVPSSPDNDAPRDRPSDNGGGGSASNGGNAGPAVIAVGVIGSVVALSLILGLLFWFLKRRSKKNFNYVIKTPVLPDSKTGSNEKKWEFDTGSLGPTARSARLPEIVSNGWRALSKIFKPADSISAHSTRRLSGMNVNRRGSEFMADTLPPPAHSRHSSVKLEPHHLEPPGMKNLFGGWWSRDKQFVASSGDALRHSAGVSQFGARGNMPKRRSSEIIVGYGARRPRDQRSSKVSADDFSGALGLMLNKLTGDSVGNPFSDTNATRRNSAGAARLSSTNPFADTYAVGNQYPPPHTPRARGSTTGSISTPAPALAQPWATPSDTRSNVRSDQFDLEIDGHNASISLSSIAYDDGLKRPTSMARIPGRDSYSSRVVSSMSSEIGLDGWGEPGPDVGLGLTSQTQQTERNPDRLPYIGEAI